MGKIFENLMFGVVGGQGALWVIKSGCVEVYGYFVSGEHGAHDMVISC